MNAEKEKLLLEASRRNPFWVCAAVFLLLACDQGMRISNLVDQRGQLDQARLMQAQNLGALVEAQQLETRLQALSLDLLQVAKTNAIASKIVQEFNIQWNPAPGAPAPVAPVAATAPMPAPSTAPSAVAPISSTPPTTPTSAAPSAAPAPK